MWRAVVLRAVQWLEKYRPQEMKDIVGNVDTVGRLEQLALQGNMPNLILSGPPGTGKTTSVLALARQLLGDAFKEGVLELNASDDRGIEVVRGRIKAFAQKKVTLPPGRHKIIVLDEVRLLWHPTETAMYHAHRAPIARRATRRARMRLACSEPFGWLLRCCSADRAFAAHMLCGRSQADAMTEGAQQAMRRTMEIYSSTTRFALACNLSEKIIEPIQSRCAILRYSKLTDEQVRNRCTLGARDRAWHEPLRHRTIAMRAPPRRRDRA